MQTLKVPAQLFYTERVVFMSEKNLAIATVPVQEWGCLLYTSQDIGQAGRVQEEAEDTEEAKAQSGENGGDGVYVVEEGDTPVSYTHLEADRRLRRRSTGDVLKWSITVIRSVGLSRSYPGSLGSEASPHSGLLFI